MEYKTDLRYATTKYFDSINYAELNDQWIDEVIDNEFTDAEENNITISVLFVNDPVQTLNKLQEVCLAWLEKSIENESMNASNANESAKEEVMWTILDEMDVGVKHIQSIIYLLCHRAMKDPSQENLILGLTSSKFYFNCLKVPGSGAYSVYHPNLFQLCVNSMPVPDFTSDKDGAFQRMFEKLASAYVPALTSLIPLFKDFHLGDDSSVIESTIKKLVEMTTCEVQLTIDFSYLDAGIQRFTKSHKLSFCVTVLAYQALSTIIDTDLNGDRDKNYNVTLSYLNRSILCFKARKSPSVSQKHLQVKDNAVKFINYNLQNKEFCSEVTQIAIKRLCLGVSDKTDIRNTVSLSIIQILFNLKNDHIAEMVEWFLLLVDSSDTKDRVFALDVLGHLLSYSNRDIALPPPDACQSDLFNASVIFAILTRCDDVSPGPRTKALTVLSQNMNCIFNFLDKTKEISVFEIEDSEDIEDKDIDVNGNHRYFWYNLKSFRERLNEIASILQRRIEDNNVTARKAALIALENLMVFDITYVTDENLKFFYAGARDANIVVRKQMIQSLTVIAEAHLDNVEVQKAWLKCILPLLHDPENTVQGTASLVLQKQILQTLLSHNEADKGRAFNLLEVLSSGEFLSHQVYVKKAFSLWKNEGVLKPQSIIPIESYIGSSSMIDHCIWFFFSHFSSCCSLPTKILSRCTEEFKKMHSAGEYPYYIEYILKILMNSYKKLPSESLEVIKSIICESIKSYSIPVEVIHLYIEMLYKIYQHFDSPSEFEEISGEVIQEIQKHLTEIKSQRSFPEPPSEELLAKYFCIIKEFCQLCSSNITPSIVSLLKAFSACVELSRSFMKILTPGLQAHAFAALGKICLQDEIIAKELLPIFAKALLTSRFDIIRNNIVIILVEMCKRYTSFADKYVPLISLCFKDKLYLIRYQTIVLVVNLLQEGFIKWRGPLFFCLLSTLVDEKEAIQELGRYSLSQLLQDKKKNLFSEHFIDSIFVFNHFAPPDNETVSQTVKDLERFAMKGDALREERMLLYRFLLESMDIKDRAYLIKSICEILTNLAEAVYPLNETTECMIRDCFNIFTCKEIRAYNVEQFEDIDEATETEVSKTELDMRRVVIIEPVIPVIVSLRNSITDPESDVMHDIILFLKEFLHDFKDSLRDILAIDKILLRQLELELKNDAEKERMEKRLEKESRDKNKQTSSQQPQSVANPSSAKIDGLETLIKDVSRLIGDGEGREEDRRESSPQQSPSALSPRGRSSKQRRQSTDRGNDTNRRSNSSGSSQPATSGPTPENSLETNGSSQLSSTPRVVLKKLPLTTNILNISPVPNVLNFSSDED